MAQIIQKISVDVSKPNFFQAIVAKQYDSGTRFVKATFIHNNEKVYIEPTATVTINATRKDGSKSSFAGVVNDDGTATLPLTYWMLELVGTVKCDISVLSGEGRLTSTNFDIEVEKASNDNGDVSEDENYDVLLQLIEEVKSVVPDQTYNPESENAQSGKAVAQALAGFEGGGGTGTGGGINSTAINLLIDILQTAIYSANVSGKIEQLQTALAQGGSGGSGSGGDSGSGDTPTTADDITVTDGIMTIVSVGSEISVTDGIMTIL